MKLASANAELDRALFAAKLDSGLQVGTVYTAPTGD